MTQPAGTSAADKEKTARLIENLSDKEQADLLAQALLREFMHRRGLRETLKAFDDENPRDERTISSRALMKSLLNIPVEGRPSRLRPTKPATGQGKPVAPTFMEELCSYRLTKRGYTHPKIRLGDEPPEGEEDPSDSELVAMRTAAEQRRHAKAVCEQQLREFEELLAEEEDYQRRKEAHMFKKKQQKKHKGHKTRKNRRHSQDMGARSGSSDDGSNSGSDDADTNDEDEEREESAVGSSLLADSLERRLSDSDGNKHQSKKSKYAGRHKSNRRLSSSEGDGTSAAIAGGSSWQPPGLSLSTSSGPSAASKHSSSSGDDGLSRTMHQPWTPSLELETQQQSKHKDPHGDEERDGERERDYDDDGASSSSTVDPFGSTVRSQQAILARVRAGSEHWAATRPQNASSSADPAAVTAGGSPSKGLSAATAVTNASTTQPAPLAVLSGAPGAVPSAASSAALGHVPAASLRSDKASSGGGGGPLGLSALGSVGSGGNALRSSTAAAGYNPNAVSLAVGAAASNDGTSALGGSADSGDAAQASGPAVNPYSNGFPPPPGGIHGASILVKHTDAHGRDTRVATTVGSPILVSSSTTNSSQASPVSSLGRKMTGSPQMQQQQQQRSSDRRPHGFAVSWSEAPETSNGGHRRSPSPAATDASRSVRFESPSPSHTPAQTSPSGVGGNTSGSGVRHGFGFRTSVSAENTASPKVGGGGGSSGEGERPGRKERRVKLLID